MFNEMMKNMQKGDGAQITAAYLENQKKEAEKELELFRRKADREKERKMADIETEKE